MSPPCPLSGISGGGPYALAAGALNPHCISGQGHSLIFSHWEKIIESLTE